MNLSDIVIDSFTEDEEKEEDLEEIVSGLGVDNDNDGITILSSAISSECVSLSAVAASTQQENVDNNDSFAEKCEIHNEYERNEEDLDDCLSIRTTESMYCNFVMDESGGNGKDDKRGTPPWLELSSSLPASCLLSSSSSPSSLSSSSSSVFPTSSPSSSSVLPMSIPLSFLNSLSVDSSLILANNSIITLPSSTVTTACGRIRETTSGTSLRRSSSQSSGKTETDGMALRDDITATCTAIVPVCSPTSNSNLNNGSQGIGSAGTPVAARTAETCWYSNFQEHDWNRLTQLARVITMALQQPSMSSPSVPPVIRGNKSINGTSIVPFLPLSSTTIHHPSSLWSHSSDHDDHTSKCFLPDSLLCSLCHQAIVGALVLDCACDNCNVCAVCWEHYTLFQPSNTGAAIRPSSSHTTIATIADDDNVHNNNEHQQFQQQHSNQTNHVTTVIAVIDKDEDDYVLVNNDNHKSPIVSYCNNFSSSFSCCPSCHARVNKTIPCQALDTAVAHILLGQRQQQHQGPNHFQNLDQENYDYFSSLSQCQRTYLQRWTLWSGELHSRELQQKQQQMQLLLSELIHQEEQTFWSPSSSNIQRRHKHRQQQRKRQRQLPSLLHSYGVQLATVAAAVAATSCWKLLSSR